MYSQKENKLSTRKKDLQTNHRDALIAEEQKKSRKITTTTDKIFKKQTYQSHFGRFCFIL